jgi:hypothetical protein
VETGRGARGRRRPATRPVLARRRRRLGARHPAQDLKEAAKGYTDAASEILEDVDAAVDRLKGKVTDAFRKARQG